ncbi:hypothetical protein [Acinetobacter baumannii]|uniref:hypothetical protein n=1 Tax=Acinetobacter baumannii TaxID=470 RepID=UPI0004486BDB|nr:hypothetical protein [Acinetobacter baumannii]EXR50333.1 hypothetical protein J661_0541 [Acinetobacter baumannii 1391434]HEE6636747.1 hypothetical protein [Acinetobacter baumannii]
MDFLSFNELKSKLSELYKRNVENAEATHFIKDNHLKVFTIVDGLYAGGYENVLTEKLVKKIFQEVNYIEIFRDRYLNSLMFGDVDKVSVDKFKKIYGEESKCDGFIILPNDIHERMFIEKHVNGDENELPLNVDDLKKYYDQSEVSITITRNSICVSKIALEEVLGEPLIAVQEDLADCAVLKGNEKSQRDARDRRGMARILAKYLESKEDGDYKAIDIANKVIDLMNTFEAGQTKDPLNMKRWISCVLKEDAKKPGVRKLKKLK